MAKYRKMGESITREQLVKIFKALGNENRLKLLEAIYEYQQRYSCCPKDFESLELTAGSVCCVDEITRRFDMAQSTISEHLKELHGAGLLERHKRAQWVYYTINRAKMEELAEYLGGFSAGEAAE